jgi:hypothetical protein
MGQTNRQRVKEWREKKAREGGRSLSVWLEPEIAKKLDELKGASGESTAVLVARAVSTFHSVTCNTQGTSSPSLPAEVPEGGKAEKPVGAIPAVLSSQEEDSEEEASITCNKEESAPDESPVAAVDDSIADITATFGDTRDFSAIHERLASLLRLRIKEGVPYSTLMKELNGAALPAPGGEDTWRRSTIFAFLR